jgi:hypothetical protein
MKIAEIPNPDTWATASPELFAADAAAFHAVTDQRRKQQVLAVDPPNGSTVLRSTSSYNAPYAQTVLLNDALQRNGYKTGLTLTPACKYPSVSIYVEAEDEAIVPELSNPPSVYGTERHLYHWLAANVCLTGLLRSTVFRPGGAKSISLNRAITIPHTPGSVRSITQRSFMSSVLIRDDYHRQNGPERPEPAARDEDFRADYGLYGILREQGVQPLSYFDLSTLVMKAAYVRTPPSASDQQPPTEA